MRWRASVPVRHAKSQRKPAEQSRNLEHQWNCFALFVKHAARIRISQASCRIALQTKSQCMLASAVTRLFLSHTQGWSFSMPHTQALPAQHKCIRTRTLDLLLPSQKECIVVSSTKLHCDPFYKGLHCNGSVTAPVRHAKSQGKPAEQGGLTELG